MAGSLDDKFICDLMDAFGSDGYVAFFGNLEIMADNFDPKMPEEVTITWRYFRRKVRLSAQKLKKILNFCEDSRKFIVNMRERDVTIKCSKFSRLCDEYAQRLIKDEEKKAVGRISGQYRDKVRVEVEEEVEVDKKKKKEKKVKDSVYAPSFERFWEAYPKKIGKGAALRAFKAVKQVNDLLPVILTAVERQKQSEQWRKDNGQFIPNPTTWLNQGRWEDEVEPAITTGIKPRYYDKWVPPEE